MARTAPAPNIPVIPGMCPGIVIAGGGGGAGGGSGGSAQKGKGKKGASSKKKGRNAKGGKKGAKSGKKKCGDPIDVVTGQMSTRPRSDLSLPGPLPFDFVRTYDTEAIARGVGLGFGWSFSYGYRIEIRGRSARVWDDVGKPLDLELPEVGGATLGLHGWILRRESWGFVLDVDDDRFRIFSVSLDGGRSWLQTAEQDRNGNRIGLTYDDRDGRLVEVIDSAGRAIRVSSDEHGRIAGLSMRSGPHQGTWVPLATYHYDARGDLVEVVDAAGHRDRYLYDERHRMLGFVDKNGLHWHYRYDDQGRCTESWGAFDGRPDPALTDRVPRLLGDGQTLVRGIHHVRLDYVDDGYTEVADGKGVLRYLGNEFGVLDKGIEGKILETFEYDERGHLVGYGDPAGAVWKWRVDGRGNVVEQIDPLGGTVRIDRDRDGKVVRVVDEIGAETRYEYDERGNCTLVASPAGVRTARYDERGLPVEIVAENGARLASTWDAEGNLVELRAADGGRHRYVYDAFGRVTTATTPDGATRHYAYGPRGELLSMVHPSGAISRYEWDGEQNLVLEVLPDGRTREATYGGNGLLCSIREGGAPPITLRYDLEEQLVEVRNAIGEIWSYEYDASGFLVRETTFDGRVFQLRNDARGNVDRIVDPAGDTIDVTYDALGRIVERACSDGHVDRIEWDPRSLIARASNDRVGVVFERDLAGRVVRETQTFDGVAHEVRTTYDPSGNLIERSTDRGWIERIERDARGLRARTWFDGVSIAHERDPLGRERNRHLPGNARIESTFDESGLLLRRAVLGPQAGQMDHVAPPWVGNVAAERVDLRYRYDRLHAVEAWDPDAGVTTFHLDPFGALLARLPAIARPQSFAYDDRRDVHEQGPDARPRSYGAGSRLLRRGAVEYVWNDAGRLAEKIEGDGDDARVTRYEWNTLGMLVAVDLPDGRRCEFAYDPFFRRIHKEVSGGDERSTTRFVWDSDVLVQEIRARGEVVEERSYVFDDVGFEPLAQVVTRDGAHLRHHYVLDRVGAPHRLVGDDGRVAAAYEHEAFALVPRDETAADTPIGLLGQYRDDETGLAYNRYRYYDPEIQQFLSPDPLGLQAGIHDRGGPANTYEEVDPLGLVLNTQALAAVNKIPSGTAGVYVIESADGKTKYVGSAKDVKARLKCGKHKKAHDLLNQPGTKVSVHPVDVSGVKGHTWKNPAKGGKTETVSKDRAITRTLLVEETRRFRDARPEGSTVTLTNSHQPLSAAKFHVYESQYPPVAGASLQAIAI